MHRSGTSLLAGWLRECGLPIDDGRLQGATPGNVRGHFEDKEFVSLHRDTILEQRPGSRGWIVHGDASVELGSEHLVVARELVEVRRRYALWGWKDPRSTLFLKEWGSLVPDLRVVAVWRPAREVVASLQRRSSTTSNDDEIVAEGDAIASWIRYNRALLERKNQSNERTLLLRIGSLVDRTDDAFKLVNRLVKGRLQQRPLPFDASLMVRDVLSTGEAMSAAAEEVDRVERELEKLSDL